MDPFDRLRSALADRYAVEREIGRGGMACVFLARDLRHNRDVAIKVLKPEFAMAVSTERFLQEIQIEAQLKHPYILPLFDSGDAEGLLYYVMPYVAGQSLQARLRMETQLPLDDALRITSEIAEALAHAHARGVVHRDVKPGNILLDESHALLADFGIARAITELGAQKLSDSGMVVGTPEYMGPEQCSNKGKIDGRSDIYALGCVLYEMLAGEPPFTGPTSQAIIARHLQDRPRSLRIVRPAVPEHIEEAIEVALAKVPADRFTTALKFSQALGLEGETGTAIRKARAARRRRTRNAAAAVAATAVALSVGFWKFTFPGRPVLDRNRVVLFPLSERGLAGANAGAGYDVAVMLSAALEHAQPLRWIDGGQRLRASATAGGSPLDVGELRRVARAQRAGFYIDGAVLGWAQESTTVVLRLHDTSGDSVVAQEIATAPIGNASPVQLGLTAATRLLPVLVDPGRSIDLTPLSARKPSAIALWIQGEREYRRSRFRSALTFYQRALKEDSAMAFAALKGAQAAGWEDLPEQTQKLVAIALSHRSLLPSKHQAFARGWQAYLRGSADSAVVWLAQAVAEDPEWAEAHMALGEVYYHLLPEAASPLDSLALAEFSNVARYDSGFAPPLYHLTEIAIRRENLAEAASLIERFRRFDPDSARREQLALMYRCVKDGPRAVAWDTEAAENPLNVVQVARSLSVGGAHSACAEAGFRTLLVHPDETLHWSAFLGLHGIAMLQRRYRDLPPLIDTAVTLGAGRAPAMYFMDVILGAPVAAKAEETDSIWRSKYGDEYEGVSLETRTLLAHWLAHRRDTVRLRRLRASLLTEAVPSQIPLRTLFDGHLALARADTAAAARSYAALVRVDVPMDSLDMGLVEPLAMERLVLAEFALARGHFTEAQRIAGLFDHPTPQAYLPFVSVALSIRLRAAQALGQPDLVARYQSRLRRLHGGESVVLGLN